MQKAGGAGVQSGISNLVVSSPKFVTGEWTYNTGWSTDETTASGGITDTNLVHIIGSPLTAGTFYTIEFAIIRGLGSVRLFCGTTAGAIYSVSDPAVSVSLEYAAGGEDSIYFDGTGFAGSLYNISLTET